MYQKIANFKWDKNATYLLLIYDRIFFSLPVFLPSNIFWLNL